MNIIYWTLFLLLIFIWILGYQYLKFHGEITAKEHKIRMAMTKLRHKMAGLEKDKDKLEKSIQSIAGEIDSCRREMDQAQG